MWAATASISTRSRHIVTPFDPANALIVTRRIELCLHRKRLREFTVRLRTTKPDANETAMIELYSNASSKFVQREFLQHLGRETITDQGRRMAGYAPVRIGIGLHRGELILGTIGEEERMQTTVISDAVNLASRIEGLTASGSGKSKSKDAKRRDLRVFR